MLREEVLQMQSVDFKKYADIIVNLQMKNDFYWLIKHFDDQSLDHIRSHFDKDSGMAFMNTFMQLQNEAIRLQNANVPVDSDEGQNFAKAYWNMIMDFTGGDMGMLPGLIELGQFQNTDHKWKEVQDIANGYVEQALGVYFSRLGVDPFQEGKGGNRMNEAIKISNLTKSYGTHVVLKGLNFCVQQGEIFGLLGINGAGKTTSLNVSRV